jgi:hypothetical protein
VAQVREEAGAPNAARVLYRNVYGWFEPAGAGLYRLTEEGGKGLMVFRGRFAAPRERSLQSASDANGNATLT